MSAAQKLLAEFDEEMATTRRVIERVPSDRGEWKPHPKSFPLGHLTQLVSMMPGWIANALTSSGLDIRSGQGYGFHATETLLGQFDQHVREAQAAIAAAPDEDLALPWALKMGDKVLFSTTRGVVARQSLNHLVHHRGQLTVYLRLLDVPVPSIYGPTADEPWGA